MGIPLEDFTEEAYRGLVAGHEEVVVGPAKNWYDKFEPQRRELFENLVASQMKPSEKT